VRCEAAVVVLWWRRGLYSFRDVLWGPMFAFSVIAAVLAISVVAHAPGWHPELHGWVKGRLADSDDTLSLMVALKHEAGAVDKLTDFVSRVSDPDAREYGTYMSLDELTDLMAPHDAAIDAVEEYFSTVCGCDAFDLTLSRDFAVVRISAPALSSCTGATFHEFTHATSGRQVIRTLDAVQWTYDAKVGGAIELIQGVNDFLDTPKERKGLVAEARRKLRENDATSAPEVRRVRGGSDTLSAALVLYCPDGTVVLEQYGSCGVVNITTVNLTMSAVGYAPVSVALPLAQLNAVNDGQTQWFYFPLQHVPKVP
jgi:hypothetical protein